MGEIEFCGYIPGAIGKVTELQAVYYGRNWNFGLFFESWVATGLSEFLNRFDETRDLFLVALDGNRIVGSLTIDGSETDNRDAHLRWFIVEPDYWGRGIGRRLMEQAMRFCRQARLKHVYLWTFAGLDAARHVYESFGFKLAQERRFDQWGKLMTEQKFILDV